MDNATFTAELDTHRRYLLRVAHLQLRDADLAEDVVQETLPPNTARVFMMREVMELESDEICKELTITANNLWVILYRARMALRQCLEQNWFAGQGNG